MPGGVIRRVGGRKQPELNPTLLAQDTISKALHPNGIELRGRRATFGPGTQARPAVNPIHKGLAASMRTTLTNEGSLHSASFLDVNMVDRSKGERAADHPRCGGNGAAKNFRQLKYIPGLELPVFWAPIKPSVFAFVLTMIKQSFGTFR